MWVVVNHDDIIKPYHHSYNGKTQLVNLSTASDIYIMRHKIYPNNSVKAEDAVVLWNIYAGFPSSENDAMSICIDQKASKEEAEEALRTLLGKLNLGYYIPNHSYLCPCVSNPSEY